MEVDFLFLDESISRDTAWLTGVFVSATQYPEVRDAMIRLARSALEAMGRPTSAPMEFHGVAMLSEFPEATDELKLQMFSDIVDLVNQERLDVISVGHSDKNRIQRSYSELLMDPGDKLYRLNLSEFVEVLHLHEDVLVVPVFDGVPGRAVKGKQSAVDRFAHDAFLHGGNVTHWNRVHFEERPSPLIRHKPNLANFMEPLFADSARSPLLRLADVMGYLLDTENRGTGTESEWKSRVSAIAAKVDPPLVYGRSVSIHFENAPATPDALE